MWTIAFNEELVENAVTETDGRLCRKCYRTTCACARLGPTSSSQGKRKSKEQVAAMVARIKKQALQHHNAQRR